MGVEAYHTVVVPENPTDLMSEEEDHRISCRFLFCKEVGQSLPVLYKTTKPKKIDYCPYMNQIQVLLQKT